MWPWRRHRRDQLVARKRADAAEAEAARAELRLAGAEVLAQESRRKTDALRREVARNGWTELLQNAWGGR